MAMRQTGQALTMAAKSLLQPGNIQHMAPDGALEEVAMSTSVSLGMFGYRHITTMAPEEVKQLLDLVRMPMDSFNWTVYRHR